jgi:hypothetical protein
MRLQCSVSRATARSFGGRWSFAIALAAAVTPAAVCGAPSQICFAFRAKW